MTQKGSTEPKVRRKEADVPGDDEDVTIPNCSVTKEQTSV